MPTMHAERAIGSCPAFGDPAGDDRDRRSCSRLVGMADGESKRCVSSSSPGAVVEGAAILDY